MNQLKTQLEAGERVFGTWSMLSSPSAINVVGHSGVDFVIVDLEHGPSSLQIVEYQLYAAEAAGISPIVRLPEPDDSLILRTLELGTQSLMVSHIDSAEMAQCVVSAAKYPPQGERGLSPFTRNHGYSEKNLGQKLVDANANQLIGVLVEGKQGLDNLDEIAAVADIDLVYLGVYDISQALGVPGQLDRPEVIKVMRESVARIEDHGLVAGSVAQDSAYLKLLVDSGFKFIAYRVDAAILRDGLEAAYETYRSICER